MAERLGGSVGAGRVAPNTIPSTLSYFQLTAAHTKLLQASERPLSFPTFLQLQSAGPTLVAVASHNAPTSGYLVRPTGETLQKCPATGAPPSASCRTRHWSMLWQVQWWAKPSCALWRMFLLFSIAWLLMCSGSLRFIHNKLIVYNVSSGKRHSHDRLLPFGHSQKQIAGWAPGLIMLVRGYTIVDAQQSRAELFVVIKIIVMDLLANIELTWNLFLEVILSCWWLCHLLEGKLIN